MNVGALIVLGKLLTDALGPVSLVGPPSPNGDEIPSLCYLQSGFAAGKFTWLCYLKYVDSAASYSDYQDYLTGD